MNKFVENVFPFVLLVLLTSLKGTIGGTRLVSSIKTTNMATSKFTPNRSLNIAGQIKPKQPSTVSVGVRVPNATLPSTMEGSKPNDLVTARKVRQSYALQGPDSVDSIKVDVEIKDFEEVIKELVHDFDCTEEMPATYMPNDSASSSEEPKKKSTVGQRFFKHLCGEGISKIGKSLGGKSSNPRNLVTAYIAENICGGLGAQAKKALMQQLEWLVTKVAKTALVASCTLHTGIPQQGCKILINELIELLENGPCEDSDLAHGDLSGPQNPTALKRPEE